MTTFVTLRSTVRNGMSGNGIQATKKSMRGTTGSYIQSLMAKKVASSTLNLPSEKSGKVDC